MNNVAALLAVALTFPRPVVPKGYDPETENQYVARVTVVATAIASVSRSKDEEAALLELAEAESGLDPIVHAGGVHPRYDQDKGRARSLWQLHASKQIEDWDHLAGADLESTTRAARAAVRVLRSAAYFCTHSSMLTADDLDRVFAEYGAGSRACMPTRQSAIRSRQWAKIRAKL